MKEKIDEILVKAIVFNAILLFLVVNITLICSSIIILYANEISFCSVFLVILCLGVSLCFNFISFCLYKTILSDFLEE